MKIYQAHYKYDSFADDELYYGGQDGKLYTNKEACEKEAEFEMSRMDYIDRPTGYIIVESEVLDTFAPSEADLKAAKYAQELYEEHLKSWAEESYENDYSDYYDCY